MQAVATDQLICAHLHEARAEAVAQVSTKDAMTIFGSGPVTCAAGLTYFILFGAVVFLGKNNIGPHLGCTVFLLQP
jgi:hypothetical protein